MQGNVLGKVRQIVKYPNQILRSTTQRLEKNDILSREVQQAVADLKTTLAEHGGLGLAAPQIGLALPIFAMLLPRNPATATHPLIAAVINPTIKAKSKQTALGLEGCFSLEEYTALVKRHVAIDVEYYDEQATLVSERLKGLQAVIFQHEADHLHGVLMLDREATNLDPEETKIEVEKAMERLGRQYEKYGLADE